MFRQSPKLSKMPYQSSRNKTYGAIESQAQSNGYYGAGGGGGGVNTQQLYPNNNNDVSISISNTQ